MKGDFSRFTFDKKKHYARVLMQQGRVQLDADWNEQVAMLLHRLETMARDLIGPFGGPAAECGFVISVMTTAGDFGIGKGRYYVDGLLCENDHDVTYTSQPRHAAPDEKFKAGDYLVYLDAWEEAVNPLEDPDIREKALGGLDTAGRSKVVWRVALYPYGEIVPLLKNATGKMCDDVIKHWKVISNQFQPEHRGALKVKAESESTADTPCNVQPSAHYRGLENQLYRIEIHTGGTASPTPSKKSKETGPAAATFKWSRENGSVIFPVASANGQVFTLERLGGDSTLGLCIDDWIELIDDERTGLGGAEPLLQVKSIDPVKMTVTVAGKIDRVESTKHPYLRRWDQKQGAENKGGLRLYEGAAAVVENTWFTIENGIQIRFERAKDEKDENIYRSGDFWYVPARTVDDGKITWPDAVAPEGVTHHYAPLAIVKFEATGQFSRQFGCVVKFDPPSKESMGYG